MNNAHVSRLQLLKTVLLRFGLGFAGLALMFFLPAGTINYWQAWAWLIILIIPMLGILVYLLKNDPALLERRMRTREREKEQGLLIKLSYVWFLLAFLLPGFDHRFGWSHVPTEIVIASEVIVLAGYCMFILVMLENSYASRVVEVEAGQTVISSGPYSIVRHPMYLAAVIMYAFTPLALGSYWAILPALLILPILVARILNEEQVLVRDLPGYPEYVQQVKHRLVPGVW
jgi:protein-S-isoprenylcysteine O-methyltransferase Ste14